MKKVLLATCALFFSLNIFSQSKVNLVVFSEDGDRFYLVINGIRQNMTGETNVKVTDLTTESFSFKIIFEDANIEAISKTQYLPFGNEYTFRIKTDKKGKKVMKPFGQTELSQPSVNTASKTIVYHTEETPATVTTNTSGNALNTGTNVNGVSSTVNMGASNTESSTTTTTTTTTTTSETGTGGTTGVGTSVNVNETGTTGTAEKVSVGMNVGGVGMNIDINVSENGMNTNTNMNGTGTENSSANSNVSTSGTSTSTYSSTTTTTTTTTGTAGSLNANMNANESNTAATTGTTNYACGAAMGSTDFASAKKSIGSKDFEDSKFTVAKQVTKNNCLSAAQIKEVMELFDFEDTRLDYAKFAYDFCYDKNNYYKLNDGFQFESSVDELNEYIEKK